MYIRYAADISISTVFYFYFFNPRLIKKFTFLFSGREQSKDFIFPPLASLDIRT
jgi:hypothetical protein